MYRINDLVVVVGSIVTATQTKKTAKLAKVVEVGLFDLVLEASSGYWKSHFIASKEVCIPIKTDWLHAPQSPPAEIGDLVLYYKKGLTDEAIEKFVGHLYEIQYEPGKPPTGKINANDGMKEFPLKDLVIIEKACKKPIQQKRV
jgi:hypothetical protein